MKTRNFLSCAAALTACVLTGSAACIFTGCGGSSGGSKPPAALTGAVRFQIQWPAAVSPAQAKAHPALIPLDAKSIVITIKDGATVVAGPTVISAPAAGAVATATIPSLPLKALTALVETKADPAGQGAAETAASEMVTPASGTPSTAPTLVLQSQITNLTISTPPSGIAVVVGGAAFLSATPTNAQGQVVMVDPNTKTIQWTAGAGLAFSPAGASTGLSVQLTGTTVGTASVSATYHDGSAATGDAVTIASNGGVGVSVVVQALPTGRPPNVPQYVSQAGLAIGPTGSGPGSFLGLSDVALGSFYTADPRNSGFEVQKYVQQPDGSFGPPVTLSGGGVGPAPDPGFNGNGTQSVLNATSVAVDSADSVYVIGDVAIISAGSIIGTVFKFSTTGQGGQYLANVRNATGLTVDSHDNLIVAEKAGANQSAAQIEVYSSSGALVQNQPISTPALQAGVPTGLTVDKADNIYVLVGGSLVKLKPNTANDATSGYVQDTSFGNGGVTIPLVAPARVAVDTRPGLATTGNLYVTLPQDNQVEVFDKNGVDSGKLPLDIPLSTPTGITIDNRIGTPTSGYIYIGNQVVQSGTPNVDNAVHVFKPQ